ncbi:MAG: exodeoxyribonuclease small subunit [Verrucomicrobiota bacterium]
MPKSQAKHPEPTFESALERLEQIVEEMEGDRLALEDLLARYEEGTRLVKVCQHRLDAAEKRIELITRDASNEVHLDVFDPAAAGVVAPASGVAAAKPNPSRRPAPDDVSLF